MVKKESALILSIIVPAFNVEKYIGQCIESIFNSAGVQNSNNIEVIAVNDASTDSTLAILNDFENRLGIKVINSEHVGVGAARNIGLKIAQGKFIYLVDSDDFLIPHAIEQLLDTLKNDNITDIFEIENDELKENGLYVRLTGFDPRPSCGTGEKIYADWENSGNFRHLTWTKIIRNKLIQDKSLFFCEGIVHEDEEWTARIYAYANYVQFLPIKVYVYRSRIGSIMHTQSFKNSLDMLKAFDLLLEFTKHNALNTLYTNAIYKHLHEMFMGVASNIHMYDDKQKQFLLRELAKREWIMSFGGSIKHCYIYKYLMKLLGIELFFKIRSGHLKNPK